MLIRHLLSLTAMVIFLSACGGLTAQTPNPVSGHIKTNVKLSNKEIKIAKRANVNQYKFLLVRSNLPLRQQKPLIQTIKNMGIIKNVYTPDMLQNEKGEDGISYLAQTNFGLKQLNSLYGRFLILDIHTKAVDITETVIFDVIDSANDEMVFSAENTYQGFLPTLSILYHPLLNALADWTKQNKHS